MNNRYDIKNGSYLKNGYVVLDIDVRKRAEKKLTLFDWIFNHNKVTSEILWSHTELMEAVQDLPQKTKE